MANTYWSIFPAVLDLVCISRVLVYGFDHLEADGMVGDYGSYLGRYIPLLLNPAEDRETTQVRRNSVLLNIAHRVTS